MSFTSVVSSPFLPSVSIALVVSSVVVAVLSFSISVSPFFTIFSPCSPTFSAVSVTSLVSFVSTSCSTAGCSANALRTSCFSSGESDFKAFIIIFFNIVTPSPHKAFQRTALWVSACFVSIILFFSMFSKYFYKNFSKKRVKFPIFPYFHHLSVPFAPANSPLLPVSTYRFGQEIVPNRQFPVPALVVTGCCMFV